VLKSGPFVEYRDALATIEKTPDIVAAEPFIFIELTYTSAKHAAVAGILKGVDPVRVRRVLAVGKHVVVGTMDSLASGDPPSLVLGDALAKTLAVKIGDQITATLSDAKAKVFRVGGIFHVAFDEYDEHLAYAPLAAVQDLVGRGDEVMGIEATVKDLGTSGAVAKAIETARWPAVCGAGLVRAQLESVPCAARRPAPVGFSR
jgi:ABC-type lipoprotein release transport system permease subunit